MFKVSTLRVLPIAATAVLMCGASSPMGAATGQETQARISADLTAGRPIVVHLVVALCDNENQGIVPVPRSLGNGQDPNSNLYWGARYGVRNFFSRRAGWISIPVDRPTDGRIRERLLFFREETRRGVVVPVYVVADAWDGARIKSAIEKFLAYASAATTEAVSFRRDSKKTLISAGGSAHLVAFVGHNGLMDFSLPATAEPMRRQVAGSSIVLACASKPFFLDLLREVGSHPLLLTTGLMAPEAYTLDAAIRSWARGDSVAAVRETAASAYHEYQNCSVQAARNLFWGQEP